MAVVEVRTFKDIQDAILRRGKIEDTSANRTKIKEYTNTLYSQISRKEAYRWCGNTVPIRLRGRYNTGTITVTNGSDEIVGDSTVWTENDHRYSKLYVAGSNQVFTIIRVESNTAATLNQPWVGTTGASKSYQIYRDLYGMPPDFQDIRKLRIPGISVRQQPRPISPLKMDHLMDTYPFRAGLPRYYTIGQNQHYTEKTWATFNLGTDYWEDDLDTVPRNEGLRVWPSILTADSIALARYTIQVYPMGADTDEPLIPYYDRAVLVWGVLVEHFLTNRDLPTQREWKSSYKDCLKSMASDIETTDDELILWVDKRGYRRTWGYEDEDEIATSL